MALSDIALSWLLVAVWFTGWEVAAARLERRSNAGGWLRAPVRIYLTEALLLTLFGALWMGSLGRGGWPLMFALLGLLMEWPGGLRSGQRPPGTPAHGARVTAAGVVRVLAAGAIIAWRMH